MLNAESEDQAIIWPTLRLLNIKAICVLHLHCLFENEETVLVLIG